jgi:hypothetical protein
VKGRKRHALVDTDGRALVLKVHPASVQDRDGDGPLVPSRSLFPFIERVFADNRLRCRTRSDATRIVVEIVRKLARTGRVCRVASTMGGRTLLRLEFNRKTGAWPKISRGPTPPRPHSCTQPPSCF